MMFRLHFTIIVVSLALTLLVSELASATETASLTIRFQLDETAPPKKKIEVDKDVEFCGQTELFDESLIVNPKNRGIQNAILYLYTGRRGTVLPDKFVRRKPKTIDLSICNCRFEPHIAIAQAGDTVRELTPDALGHNINYSFFSNLPSGLVVVPRHPRSRVIDRVEPAPIPLECNIHPWERGYLVVLEHSFAALSDQDGHLTIEGLPVGMELHFRVFHESARIDSVTVNGKPVRWERSRFTRTLKTGNNDLGTVVVPFDCFTQYND